MKEPRGSPSGSAAAKVAADQKSCWCEVWPGSGPCRICKPDDDQEYEPYIPGRMERDE